MDEKCGFPCFPQWKTWKTSPGMWKTIGKPAVFHGKRQFFMWKKSGKPDRFLKGTLKGFRHAVSDHLGQKDLSVREYGKSVDKNFFDVEKYVESVTNRVKSSFLQFLQRKSAVLTTIFSVDLFCGTPYNVVARSEGATTYCVDSLS